MLRYTGKCRNYLGHAGKSEKFGGGLRYTPETSSKLHYPLQWRIYQLLHSHFLYALQLKFYQPLQCLSISAAGSDNFWNVNSIRSSSTDSISVAVRIPAADAVRNSSSCCGAQLQQLLHRNFLSALQCKLYQLLQGSPSAVTFKFLLVVTQIILEIPA
jgi:hypothetical protein